MAQKRKQDSTSDDQARKRGKTKAHAEEGDQSSFKHRRARGQQHVSKVAGESTKSIAENRFSPSEGLSEEIPGSEQRNILVAPKHSTQERTKLTEQLAILRDGHATSTSKLKRHKFLTTCRDHYGRFDLFIASQYPARTPRKFASLEVIKAAASAARYTAIGTVDTIAREFITYWLAECMTFLTNAPMSNDCVQSFEILSDGLKEYIREPLHQIDCRRSEDARSLKTAVLHWANHYQSLAYDSCKHLMSTAQRSKYSQENFSTFERLGVFAEPLSEARILSSSVAWDLHQPHRTDDADFNLLIDCPVKIPNFAFGANPADNGMVWRGSSSIPALPQNLEELIGLPLTCKSPTAIPYSHTPGTNVAQPIIVLDDESSTNPIRRLLDDMSHLNISQHTRTGGTDNVGRQNHDDPAKECSVM